MYAKEILVISRREKVEDYLFDGNFLKNSEKVEEKCRENLKEISLEFDKNLRKFSEKSEVLRKYSGNLREVQEKFKPNS